MNVEDCNQLIGERNMLVHSNIIEQNKGCMLSDYNTLSDEDSVNYVIKEGDNMYFRTGKFKDIINKKSIRYIWKHVDILTFKQVSEVGKHTVYINDKLVYKTGDLAKKKRFMLTEKFKKASEGNPFVVL